MSTFNTPLFNEASFNDHGLPTFANTDLATDADLTMWERKMPELAKKMTGPSGASAYDNKRLLAKSHLGKQLRKRGVDVTTLSNLTQLTDAAVFKELELIFRDLSDKEDSLAAQKAKHYAGLFNDELELLILDLTDNTTAAPTLSSIPLLRA